MWRWTLLYFTVIQITICRLHDVKPCVSSEILYPEISIISNRTHQLVLKKLRSCDTFNHIPGETYLEITNFVHGYIANIRNINPNQECLDACDAYTTDVKTVDCLQNQWCKNQPSCPHIIKCSSIWNPIEVCPSNMTTDNRRYEFIKDPESYKNCKNNLFYIEEAQVGFFRIFNRCDYCFCICEEHATQYSDIYISLRVAMANISENRVVTGVRFVKHNQIIHFQVQDAKLMPNGQIDKKTLRWVPVDDYKITDRNVVEGRDYHKLSWKHRSIQLNDVMVDKGHVITGVKFRRIGANRRLHLAILTTPVDIESGKLLYPSNRSFYKSGNVLLKKFSKELILNHPNVPTRNTFSEIIMTKDRYVRFTYTDVRTDAAQTTVPFFDAQPVVANSILSGVGLFHKGVFKSGGFIALAIFTNDIRVI